MTVRGVVSIGKEVVQIDEFGIAGGTFELLAGGVLGAAANLVLLSELNALSVETARVAPSLRWVTDCWLRHFAC